ncbi:MAG TPA: hypothetical protein VJH92_05900 [Candidatus Nanoarchaeia archaeon]|nr:hypothetical protein [Candidatus Nanoarchaeia archaeon]
MKNWLKGGLIGFILFFIGLWAFMLLTGHETEGWKCTTIEGAKYCSFGEFFSSGLHWGFVIFFSLIGFAGGAIDIVLFNRIIYNTNLKIQQKYLKIASTIVLTVIIVIGFVGILAFENWVKTMIYVIIFALFTLFLAWYIGKKRYGLRH